MCASCYVCTAVVSGEGYQLHTTSYEGGTVDSSDTDSAVNRTATVRINFRIALPVAAADYTADRRP